MKQTIYLKTKVIKEYEARSVDPQFIPPVLYEIAFYFITENPAPVMVKFEAMLDSDQLVSDPEVIKKSLREAFKHPVCREIADDIDTLLHLVSFMASAPIRLIETHTANWVISDRRKVLDWLTDLQMADFEIIPQKLLK